MEHLLHYVWKHKLFPLKVLQTTEGLPVEVIDSGLQNPNAGALQRHPCRCTLDFAGTSAGRNLPLLFPAPAAARDRCVLWSNTQHSGAAYPTCLAAVTGGNGGEPP